MVRCAKIGSRLDRVGYRFQPFPGLGRAPRSVGFAPYRPKPTLLAYTPASAQSETSPVRHSKCQPRERHCRRMRPDSDIQYQFVCTAVAIVRNKICQRACMPAAVPRWHAFQARYVEPTRRPYMREEICSCSQNREHHAAVRLISPPAAVL